MTDEYSSLLFFSHHASEVFFLRRLRLARVRHIHPSERVSRSRVEFWKRKSPHNKTGELARVAIPFQSIHLSHLRKKTKTTTFSKMLSFLTVTSRNTKQLEWYQHAVRAFTLGFNENRRPRLLGNIWFFKKKLIEWQRIFYIFLSLELKRDNFTIFVGGW